MYFQCSCCQYIQWLTDSQTLSEGASMKTPPIYWCIACAMVDVELFTTYYSTQALNWFRFPTVSPHVFIIMDRHITYHISSLFQQIMSLKVNLRPFLGQLERWKVYILLTGPINAPFMPESTRDISLGDCFSLYILYMPLYMVYNSMGDYISRTWLHDMSSIAIGVVSIICYVLFGRSLIAVIRRFYH